MYCTHCMGYSAHIYEHCSFSSCLFSLRHHEKPGQEGASPGVRERPAQRHFGHTPNGCDGPTVHSGCEGQDCGETSGHSGYVLCHRVPIRFAICVLIGLSSQLAVCNAGVGLMGPLEVQSLDSMRRILEVNLLGTIQTIQTFLPEMKAQGQGRILVTGSTGGLHGEKSHLLSRLMSGVFHVCNFNNDLMESM